MHFLSDPSFQFANPREFKGNAIHMFLAISTQIHSSKGFFFSTESLDLEDTFSRKSSLHSSDMPSSALQSLVQYLSFLLDSKLHEGKERVWHVLVVPPVPGTGPGTSGHSIYKLSE